MLIMRLPTVGFGKYALFAWVQVFSHLIYNIESQTDLPCPCAQCADRSNAQPHHQDYFHLTPNNSTNIDLILATIKVINSRNLKKDFSYN